MDFPLDFRKLTGMTIRAYGETDVGLKREKNEDAILLEPEMDLFVVADGMGGHKGGDLASKMAIASVKEVVETHRTEHTFLSPRAMIEECYVEASRRIFEASQMEDHYLQGMGTTMVVSYVHQGDIFIGNVGDSRAYLLNEKYMWQITEDHSLLNEHIKAGLIRDADAKDFQAKNIITRSVGFEREVRCDIFQRKIQPGDQYLICSDGLSGLVSDERIHEICTLNDIENSVKILIQEAKKNGGDDNITVLIIEVVD
ncbi:MAG: Stp1/IreP family PP2C-type Ser/Thr phosphatase [Bdellovibrionales bacterium]|nr:Stp1/IreP family PP2C-type Ser/Thr phosphatase [Bdellovibrionales bacterium]